jgi:hypothetical protein
MYACHGGDFQSISDDNIDDFRKQLEISEECASLGEHAIIITNRQEFLRRISVAAEEGGYRICGGLVTYYDPMVGTPTTHSGIKSVFHKRKEYQYQSEFRIAVDTHVYEPTSLRLSIGDISDIASLMRTSEINGKMRFEVGPR